MKIRGWAEQFVQDVRFGFRGLVGSPGFTVTAVLSLALGIAAVTAIFSVIYGVIIDPFPYAHPETLMNIVARDAGHHSSFSPYTPDQYLEVAERNRIFEGLIASTISDVLLTGTAEPERLRGNFVTTNTFSILGVAPFLGRYLTPADGRTEATAAVVLGYKFWQRHFGADVNVLGRNLRLNDRVRTIVGVMPPRFMWRGADVYLPIVFARGKVIEGVRYINVMGRLKPGISAAAAETDLHPILDDILSHDPAYHHEKFHIKLENFYETYPSSIRKQLWILFSAVSLLLLIACANVSNLMLARASARSREMAVRASLGAGRLRIARQLLTESLMLGIIAAVFGIALAYGGLSLMIALIPPNTIPDESKISLNVSVLLFSLGLAFFTSILFGLTPAFQAAKTDVSGALKTSGRGLAGSMHEGRLRKTLVAGEVCLSVVLLVGASLVLRTLLKLQETNWGYSPQTVLSFELPLSDKRYAAIETRNNYVANIAGRIQAIPGIEEVALNTFVHPFANWGMHVDVPGVNVAPHQVAILSQINSQYASVLHIPLKQGRFLTSQDVDLHRHLAVVNESFVHIYFKDRGAVGRSFHMPELKGAPITIGDDSFEVVGVVQDVRNVGLRRETYPEVYIPYTITGFMESYIHPMFLISGHVPPAMLVNSIKQRIRSVDPDQPVMRVETVQTLLDSQGFAEPKFSVFLFSVFAALGLLLSAIGTYGVVNYSVSRQLPGLGIRLALGAGRRNILRLVLTDGLRFILIGIIAGLLCSLFATQFISSLIWGVSPFDPVSFAMVAVVLGLIGLAACARPAWRASRIDPMVVLRHE